MENEALKSPKVENLAIKPLETNDLPQVLKLADETIGQGYFSFEELQEIYELSLTPKGSCSFVLIDTLTQKVFGLRLTYPPGAWHQKEKFSDGRLAVNLWPSRPEKTAYFQSLFIHPLVQKMGWGPKLTEASIQVLKQVGTVAIICHSWKESPNNSSYRYLEKAGFRTLKEHKAYWSQVDYECPVCSRPCHCNAFEMVKEL